MAEFTYQPPNEKVYHKAVLLSLERAGHGNLYKILANASCSINASGTYSRSRWDAIYTSVTFQIPMKEYESTVIDEEEKKILREICDSVMPPNAGLDVMHVDITPSLDDEDKGLQQDLENVCVALGSTAAQFALPADIIDKGKEMAEAYLYLYAAENYLRLFIDKVAENRFGEDYFNNLNISNTVKNGIKVRKDAEAKNNWIGVRGGSELFYLDFKDIGDVILNNWELFRPYFPEQAWISTKINEMSNCRNLVAHNSFLGDHERDVIRINFNSIVRQLNPHMK